MIGGGVGIAGHLNDCRRRGGHGRQPGERLDQAPPAAYSSGMPAVEDPDVAAHGGAFTAVGRKGAMMAEAEKMDIESDHAATAASVSLLDGGSRSGMCARRAGSQH